MDDQIALADQIAERAHASQRYGDGPYIRHPRAVAERVRAIGGDTAQIAAALLHDVLEDTEETPETLRAAGVADEVIQLVIGLTRQVHGEQKERYHDGFIARIALDHQLRLIKRADLEENMSHLSSLPEDTAKGLLRRYTRALAMINAAEQEGLTA